MHWEEAGGSAQGVRAERLGSVMVRRRVECLPLIESLMTHLTLVELRGAHRVVAGQRCPVGTTVAVCLARNAFSMSRQPWAAAVVECVCLDFLYRLASALIAGS